MLLPGICCVHLHLPLLAHTEASRLLLAVAIVLRWLSASAGAPQWFSLASNGGSQTHCDKSRTCLLLQSAIDQCLRQSLPAWLQLCTPLSGLCVTPVGHCSGNKRTVCMPRRDVCAHTVENGISLCSAEQGVRSYP